MTAMLPALAGSNILYGMGLLEMGITFCYAQLLADAEFVKMTRRVMQGIAVNKDTLAVEVIKAVGAGGNYLAEEHTIKHMRGEQSRARLIDRRSRNGWQDCGGKDMITRAREQVIEHMNNSKPLPLAKEAAAKIRRIVEEAEAELK